EIQQLQDNWRGFLGDNYADNVTYQQQLADLEKTQNAERLQIQQEYQEKSLEAQQEYLDQADQSVASVFSNLGTYVQGLATSDASPLSVEDQYKAANDNLNIDYKAAMGGDYNALSRLQSDSQSDLTLAKEWFGSGADYAKEFQKNLTMLQSVANVDTGQFTASLAKQLSANAVDATNQVKQAVDSMKTAVVLELKQFMRAASVKAA
ncbi:MAG: phage tail protein, partial [Acetobacter pasteurianus]